MTAAEMSRGVALRYSPLTNDELAMLAAVAVHVRERAQTEFVWANLEMISRGMVFDSTARLPAEVTVEADRRFEVLMHGPSDQVRRIA